MSDKKYASPLRLAPKRSRWLAGLVGVSVAGAMTWLVTLDVPLASGAVALVVIGTIAFRIFREHFGTRRVVRVVWDEVGHWRLWLADGTHYEDVQLEGDSFVAPEVIILNFRSEKRRFSLVVLPDVLQLDDRRRLRVRLRLDGMPRKTESAHDLPVPASERAERKSS